jgi:hypothetical protein
VPSTRPAVDRTWPIFRMGGAPVLAPASAALSPRILRSVGQQYWLPQSLPSFIFLTISIDGSSPFVSFSSWIGRTVTMEDIRLMDKARLSVDGPKYVSFANESAVLRTGGSLFRLFPG